MGAAVQCTHWPIFPHT